jgi:hypothetical protein
MILVTVYKDRERYESDLHKTFNKVKFKADTPDEAWADAKEKTSKIDFSQKVHVTDTFFIGKRESEIKEDVYALGFSIAQGRRFKTSMSLEY